MHTTALSSFNRKMIAAAMIVGTVISLSDVFISMAIWLFHSLIELLHTLFETLEIILDRSVEHLFHTGLHETQIIVFYVMLSITLWAGYKLWHGLPRWYRYSLYMLKNFCSQQTDSAFYAWETQSLLQKIGSILFIALCCIALYFLYF